MKIGLFVPCYVDAFHPEVGVATLELLERLGLDVVYPFDQTCCGQPMTNAGCHAEAAAAEALFVRIFEPFDYVVTPSGSCTLGGNAPGYLPQHLIVLLDPADIVANLHHAYARPELEACRYAVFHTGPSATADIEGVLIHGAQVVRSLTVIAAPRRAPAADPGRVALP